MIDRAVSSTGVERDFATRGRPWGQNGDAAGFSPGCVNSRSVSRFRVEVYVSGGSDEDDRHVVN